MEKLDFELTTDQLLLLKAAVFPPEEAVVYWRRWREYHRLSGPLSEKRKLADVVKGLDQGSVRLLPLVYHHLKATDAVGIGDLQRRYRRSWMHNQQHLRLLRQAARVLHAAGIETMLIKGLAMSLVYYRDLGARFMTDADLLIPHARRDQAFDCLLNADLGLRLSDFEYLLRPFIHASHFYTPEGKAFDLHSHLLTRNRSPTADEAYWAHARPLPPQLNLPGRMLSPTHQLFHNLVHGNAPNAVAPIRWVADCYVIYTQHAIDWDEIMRLAVATNYVWPVRHGLRVLVRDFELSLPEGVAQKLAILLPHEIEADYRRLKFASISGPKSMPEKVYNLYRIARCEHALFYKDYTRQSFPRWFGRKLTANVRAFTVKRMTRGIISL